MKIVHAIETIDPASGGPAVVAIALGLGQARMGHDVTVACYAERGYEEWLEALRSRFADLAKLSFIGIPTGALAEKYFASSARRSFRELAATAEVVHVHGMWNPFNVAASRATLENRRKLVIAPHGMLDPWSLRQGYWKKKVAMRAVWKELLNAAHFVHALNATEAALMAPLRIRSPIKIFPNGIFPEEFAHARDGGLFRRHYSITADKRYILFLGRLHHKKGLDYLIDAFELLCKSDAETHLVIAGPDEGMQSAVARWIAERGLSNRVSVVGPLYGEIKFSALAGAGCFCLPSRQEGFSMAILEALACGVPVVISEECHFPEAAGAGAGTVVPLRAAAISEALLQMLGDENRRARASASAKEIVHSRYSWTTIACELLAAYR